MNALGFSAVERVRVPASLVARTGAVLRAFGKHQCEGLVLWIGNANGTEAHISEMLVPEQDPIREEDGVGYFVRGSALVEINQYLSRHNLRLLAQVHSHPGRAYHSATDDAYAIVTTLGGFSLVVPDFGRCPDNLRAWAVYRLTGPGEWRLLLPADLKLFEVTVDGV